MIRILTDSGCDILPQEALLLGIAVVPLQVTFEDGSVYSDGIDLTPHSFYPKLTACKNLPKTSQPSPELFAAHFAEAKAAGDEMIVISISSSLSGTLQAARIAAADVDYEPYFVDSETVTAGQRLLIERAVQLRDEGMTASEIVATLEVEKKRICIFAIVDTLKYLHKGGRMPGAVAVVGGALGIKPVIAMYRGKLGMAGKARGMPGAYVALFKLIDTWGGMDESRPYVLPYSDVHAHAEPIKRYVTQNLHREAEPIVSIGAVIGTHVGTGAAGIAFFLKDSDVAEDIWVK